MPLPLAALALDIPGAPDLVVEKTSAPGSHALPLGPWTDDGLPVRMVEGEVTRQVWRSRGGGGGPLEIIRPLREQLIRQGYSILLDCDSRVCGGFDFRFAIEVLPPPDMQVDLGAFRFLSAEGEDGVVSILVSAGSAGIWVQIISVAPEGGGLQAMPGQALESSSQPVADTTGVDLREPGLALETRGRVVLSDLSFPSGSAQLGDEEFASLAALATYLLGDAARRVALVGHTDTQGSLETNITLSRRRAESVVERLVGRYGVPRRQMQAEGAGWLVPITTNLTPEGREENRRVEAVLIASE